MFSLPFFPSFIKRHTYRVNGHEFHTVLVEKGTFVMGDDQSRYEYEKPAHEVTIASDFEVAEYLVTQGLWQAVTGKEWQDTRFKGAERPVERVTWNDAQSFITELNALYRKEGGYSGRPGYFCLPTEAQWEYAARGGRFGQWFKYPFSGSQRLEEVAWYDENSHGETQPAGGKLPNVLGLYDMSGNVWEWCEDDWHYNYNDAPDDGSARVDSPRGSDRVMRGGSWNYFADFCRVAYRGNGRPDPRGSSLGFRLVFVPQSGG